MLDVALLLMLAQTQPPPPSQPRWSVAPSASLSRERFTFHIENPSRFDTPDNVPHFFEQTYDADNVWIGARMIHPLGRARGALEIALTPQRTRRADDFDTFFQPDGNIVVTGTTGGASVRSWRLSERLPVARRKTMTVDVEYAYRRHRARFHDGDGITTTTSPPSTSHRLVTTRETVVSELHEMNVLAEASGSRRRHRWDVMFGGAPVGLARLAVDLPDKYPGRTLVYYVNLSSLQAGIGYTRRFPAIDARVGFDAARTFSWRHSSSLTSRTLMLSLDIIPH